jgi:hypothetical protein
MVPESMETTDGLESVGYDALYAGMVNGAQLSIFSDESMSSKNPALVLQAYFTRLCSICYYDLMLCYVMYIFRPGGPWPRKSPTGAQDVLS